MNNFLDFVSRCKTDISAQLEKRAAEFRECYKEYGHWTEDALQRITAYTARGKMLRGALVMLAGQGYRGDEISSITLDVAVAMELLQSFLLIHDDVMDRDTMRRGATSMHLQYAAYGQEMLDEVERIHYGNAMAICCGDIAFALVGLQINSALDKSTHLSVSTRSKIVNLYNGEVIRVGGAQMDDVTFSSTTTREPSPEDALRLYRSKTGYYSIVLPLTLGALFANREQEISLLEQIGCLLGEVFQIRDDLLGLDGKINTDSDVVVKSMVSDIINRKKTYARQLLISIASTDDHRELARLESDEIAEGERLGRYSDLLERTGTRAQIEKHVSAATTNTLELIDRLKVCRPSEREILRQFCTYNSQRRV